MIDFMKRCTKLELMDLGPNFYTKQEYEDCLKKIGWVGPLLGGDRASLSAFSELTTAPDSILDVGCGGGVFALKLSRKFPNAKIIGIDSSSEAIAICNNHQRMSNLSFENRTLNEQSKSVDVVTATLLCHHLKDEELIRFVSAATQAARCAVILNDLHRHPLAYCLFWLISPLFRNRMFRYDGLLSIRRGFKRKELERYLEAAGIKEYQYSIQWKFPFRWVVIINAS